MTSAAELPRDAPGQRILTTYGNITGQARYWLSTGSWDDQCFVLLVVQQQKSEYFSLLL